MKKSIAAIVLAIVSFSAFAACPTGTRYQCFSTISGKMQCGCY